jgi:hypothetical protein
MINKNNTFDFAYAAGYIDGDGCFNIGKTSIKGRISKKYIASTIVTSTNIEIIKWFKDNFGGSIQSSKKIIKGQKQLHYFVMKSNASKEFLKHVYPYLVEKRNHANIFLNFINTKDHKEKNKLINNLKCIKQNGDFVNKDHPNSLKAISNTITPKEEDFAYFAGFIDAEGCFGISKYMPNKSPNFVYKIMLSINNSRYPNFKWIIERFGGHLSFINRTTKNSSHHNQLQWRITAKSLNKIINKIYPFLKYKQPVCKELIDFYKTTLNNGGARHTKEFRESYAQIIKIRENIVTNVHKLNLKGC